MTSHHTQCSDLACSIPSLGWLCPMTASHHCSKPQRAPPRHAPLEQCCLLAPSIQSFQIPQPSTHLLHKSNPRHTRPTRLHPIQRTHSPTCTANTRYSPNPTHTQPNVHPEHNCTTRTSAQFCHRCRKGSLCPQQCVFLRETRASPASMGSSCHTEAPGHTVMT